LRPPEERVILETKDKTEKDRKRRAREMSEEIEAILGRLETGIAEQRRKLDDLIESLSRP